MKPNESPLTNSPDQAARLPRRTVLKWFAAFAAATQLPEFGAPAAVPAAKGYGADPDLSKFYEPGDFWPLTFTPAQRETITALADLILPADHLGPAASEVRVPDFLDEWISAPYPLQQKDRDALLPGLQWLEDESHKRFAKDFAALSAEQKRVIADDICWPADAKPEFKKAAAFFLKFRALSASAYYSTQAGWKALGYVGNVPLASFDGPPQSVLDRLGVTQTVT
jgi:hypothetical protein